MFGELHFTKCFQLDIEDVGVRKLLLEEKIGKDHSKECLLEYLGA
jgi:hypothetical protein